MSSRKDKIMSKSVVLIQFILILSQLQETFCKVSSDDRLPSRDPAKLPVELTIFDSRVLNRVKTLFTRNLQSAKTTSETGQKKSIITTADVEESLHVKIDPRQFGNALLNQVNQNAARKSDIYMSKAIDATALGVAVLKLIFGKDAKMVMKDIKSDDIKATLRTNQPQPKITSWSSNLAPEKDETAERKSVRGNKKSKGSDKIGKLSMNILKMVKSFQPSSNDGTTEDNETQSVKDSLGLKIASQDKEKGFSGSDSNLERLLSLMKESQAKEEKGDKKSWVLLKVPSKQPKDELGMLNDPVASEENSSDERPRHKETEQMYTSHKTTEGTHAKHHKKNAKDSHTREGNKRLMTKIQDQVKHLADLVSKQNSEKESTTETKQYELPDKAHKQQSYEGKSFTTSRRVASKTLKSEPFQEVNAVKTDTTAHASYENSVHNLLSALEASADKHSLNHISRHEENGRDLKPRQRHVNLVPLKKKEEHASNKDVVGGTNVAGGAVVSLDALRQLGHILGLSSQQPDENRISPYTETQDTLTLATPVPPTPPPPPTTTPSPTVPTTPVVQQNSLNRISEELKMFAERGLRANNDYRILHHAEPLKWSEDLASAAEKLAYQAAKKGTAKRSELVEQKGYGENVAKIQNIALQDAGEEATRHWYNEKQNFTFSDPVIDEGTKSFTQMIWKGTQTLGMGAAKDDDTGELYVVALYSPKGNDQANLRENIAEDGEQQHSDVYASIFKKSYAPSQARKR